MKIISLIAANVSAVAKPAAGATVSVSAAIISFCATTLPLVQWSAGFLGAAVAIVTLVRMARKKD